MFIVISLRVSISLVTQYKFGEKATQRDWKLPKYGLYAHTRLCDMLTNCVTSSQNGVSQLHKVLCYIFNGNFTMGCVTPCDTNALCDAAKRKMCRTNQQSDT